MDIWERARTFAKDAAKRSHELTKEAAKRSQEFTKEAAKRSQEFPVGYSKLSDIVSEATKRSKEIAAEASKRADFIKVEALKRADQIKSQFPPAAAALSHLVDSSASAPAPATTVQPEDWEKFGVTDELREFVKDITLNTFQDFPLEDNSEMSDIPTVSNVRQDLTTWQEVHAKLVLYTVKEWNTKGIECFFSISSACLVVGGTLGWIPFHRPECVIKYTLFHSIPTLIPSILTHHYRHGYEMRYMEDAKRKSAEEVKDDVKENSTVGTVSKIEAGGVSQKSKSVSSSATDQDLVVFLLGDLGDSDDGPAAQV